MLDEKDQELLDARIKSRDSIDGPRIGDYILFPTGEIERLSYDWGDGMQTAPGGSFYLHKQASFSSGGLNPITPKAQMKETDAILPGDFWFFHHDQAGASRGVYFEAPCRVFLTDAMYNGFLGKDFQSEQVPERIKKLMAMSAEIKDFLMTKKSNSRMR